MRNIVLLFVLIILTITNNTKAQWVQANGPYGGIINSVASNGKALFASTVSGLYRSTNKGTSWERMPVPTADYQEPNIYDILALDSVIYVSTDQNFMQKSYDNGLTWMTVVEIANHKFAFNGNYIVYSDNPETDGDLTQLIAAEMDSSKTVTQSYKGIVRLNMDASQITPFINSIIFFNNRIVAGTNYGIYISSDTGQTYVKSDFNLTDTCITALSVYNGKIFAGSNSRGIFSSADSGKTWSLCSTALDGLSIRVISTNNNKIYAGTNKGVYESDDSGVNWITINNGLTNPVINSITFDEDAISAGTDGGGVFKYTDGAWTAINNGLIGTYINNIVFTGDTLFASTNGSGIYISDDSGSSWNSRNDGLTDLHINALAVKGKDLFAGTMKNGIFTSDNYGLTWNTANNGISVEHVAALAVSDNNIYAGTQYCTNGNLIVNNYSSYADSGLIYKSTNSGSSWSVVDTGLYHVFAISAIDSIILTSSNIGTKLSVDAGKSWMKKDVYYYKDFKNNLTSIKSFVLKDKNIFAGKACGGVDMFSEPDTSWVTINNTGLQKFSKLADPLYYYSIPALASNDTSIFVSKKHFDGLFGGLYFSSNNGNSWKEIVTPFEEGIYNLYLKPNITSLAVHGNYLYAGTSGFGVWKAPLSGIVTGVKDKTNETPSKYTLEQNYPNPFNPTTIIKYDMPESGFVSLKVYDILGREVQTLVNGNKIKGTYEVSFNGSNLASGVYLYKLKAGNFTSIKKMILIK
jgi:photosystem II stability/assembly factor-like uncharacterized protein